MDIISGTYTATGYSVTVALDDGQETILEFVSKPDDLLASVEAVLNVQYIIEGQDGKDY